MKTKIGRRSFLSRLGLTAAGLAVASSLPAKLFSKEKKKHKDIIVKVHPSSVKRRK